MNCIFLRRGYGTSGDGVNYVEYIESSGTQYIDTEFIPNQDTSIEMVVSGWDSSQISSSVFGSRASSSSVSYMVMTNASGVYRSDYGSSRVTFSSGLSFDGKITVLREKNVTTLDSYTVTNTASTFACTYPLFIFATNTGGSASHKSSVKVYSCKIYDNGMLVRDFRPALDPDGVACMYDKVSKIYYYNIGTGTFTAGTSISGGDTSDGGSTPKVCTVTITNGNADIASFISSGVLSVSIGGTAITAAGTFTTVENVALVIQVKNANAMYWLVTVDGQTVKAASLAAGSYSHTITSDTSLVFSDDDDATRFTITTTT